MNARTDGLAMTSVSLELGVALGFVAFGVFAILQFALPPDVTHAGAAERMPRRPSGCRYRG